jgi:hypothetical protein
VRERVCLEVTAVFLGPVGSNECALLSIANVGSRPWQAKLA